MMWLVPALPSSSRPRWVLTLLGGREELLFA
jgi:hypothetical protein